MKTFDTQSRSVKGCLAFPSRSRTSSQRSRLLMRTPFDAKAILRDGVSLGNAAVSPRTKGLDAIDYVLTVSERPRHEFSRSLKKITKFLHLLAACERQRVWGTRRAVRRYSQVRRQVSLIPRSAL